MNKKIFFIKKNKLIILNLFLILILGFSSFNLINSKEELQNIESQIIDLDNTNLSNSIKTQELENLVKLSNENGYEKEESLDMNNYFLNDLINANIVITTENLIGRDLNYCFLEGYGDKYSIDKLFNFITKKYNLAFEILEFKIWPEVNIFRFYLKLNLNKNNWVRKAQVVSLLNFNADSLDEEESGFSGDSYYYQNQSELFLDRKSENLIISEFPEYIKFKGFINRYDNKFFLFEIYNKSVIFELNQEQMLNGIQYKLYFDDGLFLHENLKIYQIGE